MATGLGVGGSQPDANDPHVSAWRPEEMEKKEQLGRWIAETRRCVVDSEFGMPPGGPLGDPSAKPPGFTYPYLFQAAG